MNLERIHQLIKDPHLSEWTDIATLKDLSLKFPYAQLFSILYLKALHQHKDVRFEDELKQYAFKITDRSNLYELIYDYTKGQFSESVSVVSETDDFVSSENAVAEKQEEVQTEELEKVEPSEEELKTEETDPLEKEFLSHIIASTYSIEQSGPGENEDVKAKIHLEEKRSFTGWLKVGTDHPGVSKKTEIIDSFIKKNAETKKIVPTDAPKKEFYSAPKKAKESVSDENLLYSETLANIFAMQGNFPKAIQAFQQLMLTNPEKKLYFAEKINELTKKLNP